MIIHTRRMYDQIQTVDNGRISPRDPSNLSHPLRVSEGADDQLSFLSETNIFVLIISIFIDGRLISRLLATAPHGTDIAPCLLVTHVIHLTAC